MEYNMELIEQYKKMKDDKSKDKENLKNEEEVKI